MKIVVTTEGQERYDSVNAWWLANGKHEPLLFVEEVAHAFSLLPHHPDMGEEFKRDEFGVIRRVLLPKTQQWLYYEVHRDAGHIEVMCFWGAERGDPPPL